MHLTDPNDFPDAIGTMPSEWKKAANYIDGNVPKTGETIFIIGPWGSGKSTFISTLIKDTNSYRNLRRIERISLSSATSENEVFTHLIGSKIKIALSATVFIVSLISINYVTWPEKIDKFFAAQVTISIFISSFLALFIPNKTRIFYILASYVECFFGKTIKVIEDFDRGALDISTIYNILLFRFKRKMSYVVALGYNSTEQRDQYVELALKLGGKVVYFDLSEHSLYLILTKLYNPPISAGKWITLITARRLITLTSLIQKNEADHSLTVEQSFGLFVEVFFEEILKRLDVKDTGQIQFIDSGRSLTGNSKVNPTQRSYINSFLISLDEAKLRDVASQFDPNSSNQREIYMTKLLVTKEHAKSVRFTVEVAEA